MSNAEIARIKWALKKHDDACNLRGDPADILEDEYVAELRERRQRLESAKADKYKDYMNERALARKRK